MSSIWVLSMRANSYDQEDEDYFLTYFVDKPNFKTLQEFLPKHYYATPKNIEDLLRVGSSGRCEDGHTGLYLGICKEGEGL